MKSIMLGLALVAVIACANSTPLSDDQKAMINKFVEHWGKMKISADVKRMLDTVHEHFPSTFVMMNAPDDSEELELVYEDLVNLGKPENCDEIMQHDVEFDGLLESLSNQGSNDRDLLILVSAEAKKINPVAYDALEAKFLCGIVSKYKRRMEILSRPHIGNFLNSTLKHYSTINVSPGVEKMLETVYQYYPSASVLFDVPWDNSKFVSFMKDVAKWGKQKDCDGDVDDEGVFRIYVPELGDMTYEEWNDLLMDELKKNYPLVYKKWEARWLCALLWENPMYLGFMKDE